MNVTIDREDCIACGLCAETCPEVFRMADDGLAEVHGQATGENRDMVREAADSCPVSVIKTDE